MTMTSGGLDRLPGQPSSEHAVLHVAGCPAAGAARAARDSLPGRHDYLPERAGARAAAWEAKRHGLPSLRGRAAARDEPGCVSAAASLRPGKARAVRAAGTAQAGTGAA